MGYSQWTIPNGMINNRLSPKCGQSGVHFEYPMVRFPGLIPSWCWTHQCLWTGNKPSKKGSTLTPFQVPSALISRVVDWICYFLLRQFDEQMLKFRTGAVAEPLNPEIESASSLLMTPQNVMKCHHSTTKVGKSGKGGPVQGTDANRSPVPGRDISQKRQLSYQPKPRVVRQISEKISLQRLDPDLTMKQRRIKRNHVIIWGFRKMVVPQNHRLQFEY